MRFFKPKQEFFRWIEKMHKSHPKMPVIDCGCGDGDLLIDLHKLRIPAMGMDPRYAIFNEHIPIHLINCLLPVEAQESNLVQNTPAILLVCRPCHSGFPIDINNTRHKKSKFYYIGLERNIELDLCNVETKLLMHDVGEDGECLWEVFKP
jgi:hypothetical protein